VRLIAFLLLAIALTALAIYDFRVYVEAKRTVADINAIGEDLSLRGLQNSILYQKYISAEVDLSKYQARAATAIENLPLKNDAGLQSNAAQSWDSINPFLMLRKKIDFSMSQHIAVITSDIAPQQSFADQTPATEMLIANLSMIQSFNIRLTQYLSDQLLSRVTSAFAVNLVSILAMTLVGVGIVFRDYVVTAKTNQQKNLLLESRHAENIQSRKITMSIMEDLSSEKKTAEHLSHMLEDSNKNIKSKNLEMEQFIYTVSHDLKSPLVSIGGFASILSNELDGSLSDKQAHYLARIKSNVTDMEAMLSDLLELSRISKEDVKRSLVDMNSHIANVLSTFDIELKTIGGEAIVEQPIDNVFANERLLHQCLDNLISNAIAYRSPHAPLKIIINSTKSENHTIISVKDNGIGIDQKYHHAVFRIFEHLNTNVGTGVGLTIVKTVMEKHGGSVYLESELDKGTVFYLKFPSEEKLWRAHEQYRASEVLVG